MSTAKSEPMTLEAYSKSHKEPNAKSQNGKGDKKGRNGNKIKTVKKPFKRHPGNKELSGGVIYSMINN